MAGGGVNLHDHGDIIDHAAFEQILDMDDDPSVRDFSKEIVYDFFKQAENTFPEMDDDLNQKDFNKLWNHAHYLKGSAAILGLIKLRGSCENIERMGKQLEDAVKQREPKDDEDGGEENAVGNLYNALSQAKMEFAEVEEVLKRFYEGHSG